MGNVAASIPVCIAVAIASAAGGDGFATATATTTTSSSTTLPPTSEGREDHAIAWATPGNIFALLLVAGSCGCSLWCLCPLCRRWWRGLGKDCRETPKAQEMVGKEESNGLRTAWKTRFVYELQQEEKDQWHLCGDGVEVVLTEHAIDTFEDVPEESPPVAAIASGPAERPFEASKGLRVAIRPVFPGWANQTAVEYYSRSHGRWLPGELHVLECPGEDRPIMYNVRVNLGSRRTQLRTDVSLRDVRVPFRTGELVEVFSSSTGDQWVPGVIAGVQGAQNWATLYGYRVKFADDGTQQGGASERVLGKRIRRRFPNGTAVEIYRGPYEGWIGAVVDSSSTHGNAEEVIDPDWLQRPTLQRSPTSTSVFSTFSGASKYSVWSKSQASDTERGADFSPWYMVPVKELDAEHCTFVPSYLVQSNELVDETYEVLPPSLWRSSALRVAAHAAKLLGTPAFTQHEEAAPLVPHGAPVEYFSKTHRTWMPGHLQVDVTPGTLLEPPHIVYNIQIKTGAAATNLRKCVPPSAFRTPLQKGDLVEIFSRGDGGKWVPAMLDAIQDRPTENGYSVMVAFSGAKPRLFQHVPALRLRRRFPNGSRVMLYRGPVAGWIPGVVEASEAAPPIEPVTAGPPAAALADSARAPPKPAFSAKLRRTVSFASMESGGTSGAGEMEVKSQAEPQKMRRSVSFASLDSENSGRSRSDATAVDTPTQSMRRAASNSSLSSGWSGFSGASGQSAWEAGHLGPLILGPSMARQVSSETNGTVPDLCPWSMVQVRELRETCSKPVPSYLLRLMKQLADYTDAPALELRAREA